MGFCFSEPDKKELLEESRERIEENSRMLSVCVTIAAVDLKTSVERVYDAVRYMTPSKEARAAQADKKIAALSGDLKIALSKGSDRGNAQAEDILKELSIAIAERNA